MVLNIDYCILLYEKYLIESKFNNELGYMLKISVIVPVYKVEKYLKECVDSILRQSFSNFELILVDDGSPDNCPLICDEYAKKDKRVVVIHKNNGGLSSARNAGLDIATGDYIAFVDSDDILHCDFLLILYSLIKDNDCDISVCQSISFVNKDEIKQIPMNTEIKVLTPNEYWGNKNISETDFVVSWNKLYRKEIFCDLRYPVGKIHEDEFLIHRITHKCRKIVISGRVLYFYRIRQSSIIGRGENYVHQCEALIDRISFFFSNCNYGIVKTSLERFYSYYFKIGKKDDAKFILISFKGLSKSLTIARIGLKNYIKKLIFLFSRPLYKRLFIN